MKQTTRFHADLTAILAELPPESVQALEQFARFLREQARRGQRTALQQQQGKQHPYLHPTVAAPASSLSKWIGLLPIGYESDALEDSEAL
ncbi:MAG: hypothetical protein ACOYYJ_11225 [Chloroflexota bacterium]